MITGINHITLSVCDLEQSFTFYTDILGCKAIAKWQRGAYLLAGNIWFCLSLDPQTGTSLLKEYSHMAFSIPKDKFPEYD